MQDEKNSRKKGKSNTTGAAYIQNTSQPNYQSFLNNEAKVYTCRRTTCIPLPHYPHSNKKDPPKNSTVPLPKHSQEAHYSSINYLPCPYKMDTLN